MVSIRTSSLTKRFGTVVALYQLDLEIKPGELFFLLGPSGCGKTTLLRSLAGFVMPDAGTIFFGDDDVTHLEPHKRNTGMMFQSYALWPHMTVAENVAFGLGEVYVTHDQKEALSISDRMAVLEAGKILQVGTPREIYKRPAWKTVANFIGETDFIAGTVAGVENGRVFVTTPVGRFEGVPGNPEKMPAPGWLVTLSIRPECWRLEHGPREVNSVPGRIGGSVYLGEVAQHDFVPSRGEGEAGKDGAGMLKILETNPRFTAQPADGPELHAAVDAGDVVVLEA